MKNNFLEFLKTIDEVEVAKTTSNKFEVEISEKIREFLNSQEDEKYKNLTVNHYDESDSKYHSDVYISNPQNNKQVWIEVKLNKYANLGGLSFKYINNQWTCTTTDDDDPLTNFYLTAINNHAQKFIEFCKSFLKKDDIQIQKDMSDELLDAWKVSGNITDTDNDTQFITEKIPIEDFGFLISKFYQTSKNEPVYYIQIADDLYIIDSNYNPLNLITKDGKELKTLSEAYRIGRIQFRIKAMNKNGKRYFACVNDIKILADKENIDEGYECSFDTVEKWPVVKTITELDEELDEAEKDIGGTPSNYIPEEGIKIWIDDIRESPEGFKWFKKVTDFINWVYNRGTLNDVSLIDTDHDAGDFQEFGGDYIKIFEYLDMCQIKNLLIHIHSANPVGATNIRKIISKNKENGWKEIRNKKRK